MDILCRRRRLTAYGAHEVGAGIIYFACKALVVCGLCHLLWSVVVASMCDPEKNEKMAVVLQHPIGCLEALPTRAMYRVVPDQLRRMTCPVVKALPMIFNVIVDE